MKVLFGTDTHTNTNTSDGGTCFGRTLSKTLYFVFMGYCKNFELLSSVTIGSQFDKPIMENLCSQCCPILVSQSKKFIRCNKVLYKEECKLGIEEGHGPVQDKKPRPFRLMHHLHKSKVQIKHCSFT